MKNFEKQTKSDADIQNTQIKLEKMRKILLDEDKAREVAQKLTQYIKEK